jgi:hypothetical protein
MENDPKTGQRDIHNKATRFLYVVLKNVEIMSKQYIFGLTV